MKIRALLPILLAGFLFTGCYTQLQVSEPQQQERQRASGSYAEDPQDAYDLGYDDGWFDAGIYYRDHRRATTSMRSGYRYGGFGHYPRSYSSFSFGFSYGYGSFYDPFHYGSWYHDPFYHRHHRFAHRHHYRPWGYGNHISYNYYYFYNQPASVTKAARTSTTRGTRAQTLATARTDVSRSSDRAAVGNTVRSRAAEREGVTRAGIERRSGSVQATGGNRGVVRSSGPTLRSGESSGVVRSRGTVGSSSSSGTVRSRGTVGRSSSGTVRSRGSSSSSSSGTVRSRGSSGSSGDARSRGSSSRSSGSDARSRGSSGSSSSGDARSRSRGSSGSSGSSRSRNRDRGDDQAMLRIEMSTDYSIMEIRVDEAGYIKTTNA